jgi:LAO/AO transport system kinase
VILVETVGVGQSETLVADMVDLFLVLMLPGAGDELQGIKRGIMELADVVVVNKADGDLAATATATASDYSAALHLVRPRHPWWSPRVVSCSALLGSGIEELWGVIEEFRDAQAPEREQVRAAQSRAWMWSEVSESLLDELQANRRVRDLASRLDAEVGAGTTTPTAAAHAILEAFLSPK